MRISLIYVVAATLAATGAVAQNAASSPGPNQTDSAAPTQSRPDAPDHKAGNSANGAIRRQGGPTSGNQVQAPSPDTQRKGKRSAHAAHSATETRPAAKYAHPAGQDSQPDNSSGKTVLAAPGSGKDAASGQERAPGTGQSKQAAELARRKTYTQQSGAKANPSTACSTARPTVNGEVDCGTSGNSATLGKVVTKPR